MERLQRDALETRVFRQSDDSGVNHGVDVDAPQVVDASAPTDDVEDAGSDCSEFAPEFVVAVLDDVWCWRRPLSPLGGRRAWLDRRWCGHRCHSGVCGGRRGMRTCEIWDSANVDGVEKRKPSGRF